MTETKVKVKVVHINSGVLYEIVAIHPLKLRGVWTKVILYRNLNDNRIWSRPIDNFLEKFKNYEN